MKYFHKIDKHLKYDKLLIITIIAFFIGFFLRKLGTDGQVIEGAFGLLGIITLFLAIVDFVRHKSGK
jgi:hypothetical protein